MKYLLYLFVLASTFLSCNSSNKEIKEHLTNSDSVAINYFKGDGSTDTVVAVKIIRDKETIEQLTDFIAGQPVRTPVKCGYDGSLHFFKMNRVIQDINFRMSEDDCMQFSFLQQGEIQITVLSRDAKELINSFRK